MFKTRKPIPGQAPATLTPRGVAGELTKPTITLIQYDAESVDEREFDDVHELLAALKDDKVSWVNIEGLGDVEALRHLGERFKLHPLLLEDVINTGQRPKTEQWDDYL